MKRTAVCLALFLAAPAAAAAQSSAYATTDASARAARSESGGSARNAVYVEALGNGGLVSLNYDRKLLDWMSLRVGAAYAHDDDAPVGTDENVVFAGPVMLNVLAGRGSSRLEVGAGFAFERQTDRDVDVIATGDNMNLTGTVGYRYQPARGGLLFRAGITPFYSASSAPGETGGRFEVTGGVSVGFTF
jgi:hypothetical protein